MGSDIYLVNEVDRAVVSARFASFLVSYEIEFRVSQLFRVLANDQITSAPGKRNAERPGFVLPGASGSSAVRWRITYSVSPVSCPALPAGSGTL